MKRRDRDATLYPRGWRETEERIQESWLRNCGWEGNARCDDHLWKRGLHFVRTTLGWGINFIPMESNSLVFSLYWGGDRKFEIEFE